MKTESTKRAVAAGLIGTCIGLMARSPKVLAIAGGIGLVLFGYKVFDFVDGCITGSSEKES